MNKCMSAATKNINVSLVRSDLVSVVLLVYFRNIVNVYISVESFILDVWSGLFSLKYIRPKERG